MSVLHRAEQQKSSSDWMNAKRKRVAVIGAGASGLCAIKCCLDEELEPTCFEKSDEIGGLWRYTDKAQPGRAGVYQTTVINSSKELLAYSTFPPPAEFPNFMHHTKLYEYMKLYADEYNLSRYIKFDTEVVSVHKSKNFDNNGGWDVTFKSNDTEKEGTDTFDCVLVCTGHHAYPNDPSWDIPGRSQFCGQILHGHEYRHHQKFVGRRVMVVGIGNTGGDLAAELSRHASKLLLSTRRGAWVINRIGSKGWPYDCNLVTRLFTNLMKLTPVWLANSAVELMMNFRFEHELYGIKPKHRILSQHPLVNDELPARIANGTLVVVPDIERFRERGVVTSDGTYHEIDDVIFATGYKIKFPFLPPSVVSVDENNRLSMLYKHVFPVDLAKNPTLALIGNVQPLGGLMPIAEMQSRWAARVFKKLVSLPSYHSMFNEVVWRNMKLQERYVPSSRHTIQVDYMEYMDSIADEIGVKPNLPDLFKTDPKLAWQVLTGPGSSYQYRLYGPNRWKGAREAIFRQWDRVAAGYGKGIRRNGLINTTPRVEGGSCSNGYNSAMMICILCLSILFWVMLAV